MFIYLFTITYLLTLYEYGRYVFIETIECLENTSNKPLERIQYYSIFCIKYGNEINIKNTFMDIDNFFLISSFHPWQYDDAYWYD